MSGRASHQFMKRKVADNTNKCCKLQDGFSSNDPDIDTNVNIIRSRTRASCCFSVPIDICDFYGTTGCSGPGDTTPNNGIFETHPDHPSVTATPLPLSALQHGAVFRVESFFTTDRGGTININAGTDLPEELTLDQQEHVKEPFDIVVLRRDAPAGSGLINTGNTFIVDTPLETLNGSYAFGGLDYVFGTIFDLFSSLLPTQIGNLGNIGHDHGFLSLTNPNELDYGTPNVIQLIWPENIDWMIRFVGPNNKRYTYTAISRKNHPSGITQCNVTETDLNVTPNPTVQLGTFTCSQAWAVPCDSLEYITTRHQFDLDFPGTTGCTGITDGVVCVDGISIEGFNVRLKKDCLCAEFLDGTGITGAAGSTGARANGQVIADILNKAFETSRVTAGWKALNDIEYGYIRLVHPDNVLYFDLTLSKNFFKDETPCTQCAEKVIFKQGGQTLFMKPNEDFETITSTSNECIVNGLCWSSESDMRGCFLLNEE